MTYALKLTEHSGRTVIYRYPTAQALINHINGWYPKVEQELETLEQVLDYLSTDYRGVELSR